MVEEVSDFFASLLDQVCFWDYLYSNHKSGGKDILPTIEENQVSNDLVNLDIQKSLRSDRMG